MTMTGNDRTEITPRQPVRHSNTLSIFNRPGSPLKQEVLASPVFGSPEPADNDDSAILSRGSRVLDPAQRWTVLAREAEADEISLLSITSEEKGYYSALLPDDTVAESATDDNRADSQISEFDENAFVEYDDSDLHETRETSMGTYGEIEQYEPSPAQFAHFHSPTSPPTRFDLPGFTQAPPSDPPPYASFPFSP